MPELIDKVQLNGDGIGYLEMHDFSTANSCYEKRVEAVQLVASVCYNSKIKEGSDKLFKMLATESKGLPSSSYEFVPVLLTEKQVAHILHAKNIRSMPDVCHSNAISVIKYGEFISYKGKDYLLTNLRALIADVGEDSDKYYNTDHVEIEAIKKYFKVFKSKIDLATARQFMRSRVIWQELCVSGDTVIKTRQGARTIKELYENQFRRKNDRLPTIKTYDFDTKTFKYTKIKEVFKTGTKEVFEVKVQYGTSGSIRTIKTSKEHKFLTKDGWKRLKDIDLNSFVAINGIPLYRDKAWLKEKKEYFLSQGIGMKGMAIELGINYNTLKSWIHKHGLQYTQAETSSTFKVWNKGVTGEDSHSFGRKLSDEARQKISDKHTMKLGASNGGYGKRMRSYWEADFRRSKILDKFDNKCASCGKTDCRFELDHIKPVASHPELGFNEDNVQPLCTECHKEKSVTEVKIGRSTISYGMVVSIESLGDEETYDLEVEHKDHNYIANSIVVHNSRRYVSGDKMPFEFYISPKIKELYYGEKMVKSSIERAVLEYNWLIDSGIKPEDARRVLPQSMYTTVWSAWLPSQLKSMIDLRTHKTAQSEIRELATKIDDMTFIWSDSTKGTR